MASRCPHDGQDRGPHGAVNDNETLYRVVLSPQHMRADGNGFKSSLFSQTDIRQKGVSLIRRDKVSSGELSTFCNALAGMKPNRTWVGGLEFGASVVRSLIDDGGRMMCLLDDPTEATDQVPKNDAHALAVASHDDITEEDIREIRSELILAGVYRKNAP